jgi:hypothetical protein
MQGKAAILTLILSALLPNYGAECETSFDDAREVVERLRAIRLAFRGLLLRRGRGVAPRRQGQPARRRCVKHRGFNTAGPPSRMTVGQVEESDQTRCACVR